MTETFTTKKSRPIIVAGMHRSGTSLIASLLSALGVEMGWEMLPPDKNNPRGYYEDIGFLELQRKILSESCRLDDGGHPDWGWTENEKLNKNKFSKYTPEAKKLLASHGAETGLWGWKDPRTTLLLDFWDKLLDDAFYVFVYRFPWDVADSTQRLGAEVFLRNPEYAYKIWNFYNRHLVDFFIENSQRCVLLSINALQKNPTCLVKLICNKLKLELPEANLEKIFEQQLFSSIEHTDPLIDLVAASSPECVKLLTRLDELADLSGAELWEARPLRSRHRKENNSSAVDASVVIPCFDQGQFLIEAVASFERVAPPNCELIIINDGSKEARTLEILKILRNAGFDVIYQENQGLSKARNAGIKLAAGRYILPLDADNRLRAGFVEAATGILDSSREIGIVYGYRQFFGMKTGLDEVAEFDLDGILIFNYIDACAIFRKQVWVDCGGYDQRMSPLEDWDLWIGAIEKGWRFHRLAQITFDYRARAGSLTSTLDNPEFLDQVLEAIIIKHHQLYEPRLVKQLAKMKRSTEHLTVSVRRLSEENNLLGKELLAAKQKIELIDAIKDPGVLRLLTFIIKNPDVLRLLTFVRRIRQNVPQRLILWKSRFRKKPE